MEYTFSATGHHNILSRHRNTFEFTKDNVLTLQGDCIIGINADYNLKKIKELIINKTKLTITIESDNIKEVVTSLINPDFDDDHEMVFRITNIKTNRTLGINTSKSAKMFSREFINAIKSQKSMIKITLTTTA